MFPLCDAVQGESNRAVQAYYDNAYRRAEQQMDSATRAASSERSSPTKPYPARPKTRVSHRAWRWLERVRDFTDVKQEDSGTRVNDKYLMVPSKCNAFHKGIFLHTIVSSFVLLLLFLIYEINRVESE